MGKSQISTYVQILFGPFLHRPVFISLLLLSESSSDFIQLEREKL